ncbi:MAG: threonine ammonia-lyase IlvA [Mycobacteriaceae bacterium]
MSTSAESYSDVTTSLFTSAERKLTADEIDASAVRLLGVIAQTPLEFSERLSALTGAKVYLKREDLQSVRSYKLRGAYNLMVQLSEEERRAGVVCASAGNHAQGFAFACRVMKIQGRVYVPVNTPKQKRDRIIFHGDGFIELILVGNTYDVAAAAAIADVQETGATLVPPFDDLRTAAGQGTIAAEVLSQLSVTPDVFVVPVGGGGCISGITTYLQERSPATAVVGVEPAGAASLSEALKAGAPVTLPTIDPFVDGAAVARIGSLPYDVMTAAGTVVGRADPIVTVDEEGRSRGTVSVISVDEGALCTSILELYQNEGIIAEPAGALSVAALSLMKLPTESVVVCLISGGNNDVSRYGEILERSLVHLGLKHYFLVNFPQEPGALRRFLDDVLGPNDDITLFEYVKRNNRETGAALVGIELGSAEELPALLERMAGSGMNAEQLKPGSPAYRYLT